MLNAAERPLIVAGGGIINADASDLLVEFAETHRRAGDPDADGLGRDPRRPSADGRHGRAADQPPLRQRDHARSPTSCSASATAGPTATPARSRSTPRAASSCTSTSSRPRSAACSSPTSASSPTRRRALELFVEVARGMEGGRQAQGPVGAGSANAASASAPCCAGPTSTTCR